MTLFDNPALTQALLKLPYPLDDYQSFAAAWPHSAEEIKDLHLGLVVFLPTGVNSHGNKVVPNEFRANENRHR